MLAQLQDAVDQLFQASANYIKPIVPQVRFRQAAHFFIALLLYNSGTLSYPPAVNSICTHFYHLRFIGPRLS